MGIKSTTVLTRQKAEQLRDHLREKLHGLQARQTNQELGNQLDDLAEEVCRREGRTCFDNYLVVDDEGVL